MSSQSNREQFVKQLETILDGIKNNLAKVLNIFTLFLKNIAKLTNFTNKRSIIETYNERINSINSMIH